MRRALNTSAWALRLNTPRRFTNPPRLVETVTSGEVVTTRPAKASSLLAISNMILPKAAWVDCSPAARHRRSRRPRGVRCAAAWRRRAVRRTAAATGRAWRSARLRVSPEKASHSSPSRTPSRRAARDLAGVIKPL
jgi:hypothetical protein